MDSSASHNLDLAGFPPRGRRAQPGVLRRLRPLDRALLFTLVPLWLVCFGMTAKSALDHIGYSSVFVAAPEGLSSYPTVIGFQPWLSGATSGVQVGDLVLRVGEVSLQDSGPIRFFALVAEQATHGYVSLTYKRSGQETEVAFRVGSYSLAWPFLFPALSFAVTAVILLLRARRSPSVGALITAFFCVAFALSSYFAGNRVETYAGGIVNLMAWTLVFPLCIRAAMVFPSNVPPRSVIAMSWPWAFAVLGPIVASSRYGYPLPPSIGVPGSLALPAVGFAAVLIVMTRNYRLADAIGQRQVRWAMLGLYLAAFPPMAAHAFAALTPDLTPIVNVSFGAMALFPIAIVIAVARYNLYDVERLISATTSYSILAALLLASLLAAIPRVAGAATKAFDSDPFSTQLMLSLALAAAAIPAHRFVRPRIERIFFPERPALEEGIGRLLNQLSAALDPRQLTALAGQLATLLRPESCVVYARAGSGFEPVFAEGKAVPPAIQANSPLITTLQGRSSPLASDRFSRRDRIKQLSAFDRAALDTLGVAAVIPIHRHGELLAFLCLGPKWSGDIYTGMDLALLTSVANTVSLQLQRFDEAEVTRAARSMQEELRRYVPGAVSKEVEAGEDLEARERAVSVLFVDMRGYTSYSEPRQAHEVFSTINRYTQTVSTIVEKFGGSVVEFNGDGMMAVFGAPTPLPDKERAAVSAGREIVSKVQTLGGLSESETLSVGVGIATGSAFVGSIQAVDRMIWTALGNTTNLAARLHGLTRDLDAPMVIDLATWRAAGEPAEFERREQVPIRGRSQREDVYLLPLDGSRRPRPA